MWWPINTAAWARRRAAVLLVAGLAVAGASAQTAEVHAPAQVVAGTPLSLETSGSGEAKFYLAGPGSLIKRKIALGKNVELRPGDVEYAGRYLAIVCASECRTATFHVVPAEAARLDLLAHPSRVPVRQAEAISGTALAFDRFRNLVLDPGQVEFRMSGEGEAVLTRAVATREGIAWFRASSGQRAGAAQLTAAMGGLAVRRVVQQVAADPCNLRIHARAQDEGIVVETDPIRDCAGNPVPDGTTVTFTRTGAGGQSTVDAPIKKGIARARMTGRDPATITVASGLVTGNEIRWEGR